MAAWGSPGRTGPLTGVAMTHEITLLHVDDDESFGAFVRDWVECTEEDLQITTVTSAEAALDLLRSTGHEFDIVVSDHRMPTGSGLELFERVRERDPTVPFILFTGQGNEEVVCDALAAGVTDYVHKSSGPDSLSLLVRRIRSAVERRRVECGDG